MYTTDRHDDPINLLLTDAYIPPAHDPNDQPTAAERIARAGSRQRRHQDTSDAAMRAEREALSSELDLTCATVLGEQGAAAALGSLGDGSPPDGAGALVFGCLLYLAGRDHSCRFWWKFAAGAENRQAAYCMYLHHARAAQYDAARHWRTQYNTLPADPAPTRGRALICRPIYRTLITQYHLGQPLRLPRDLKRAVEQLRVDESWSERTDADEFTQPSTQLPRTLADLAA